MLQRLTDLVPEVSHEEWQRNFDLTQLVIGAVVLPASWQRLPPFPYLHPFYGQQLFRKGSSRDGLRVIADCSYFDGKPWLHVSCSRQKRMPTYEDLAEVKAVFVGAEGQALQIFPKRSRHVNLHGFCLHLWCDLSPEGDGLPDFGRYGTI